MKNSTIFLFLVISLAQFACTDTDPAEAEDMSMADPAMEAEAVDDQLVSITNEQFELGEMQVGRLTQAVFPYTIMANGYIDVPPRSKAAVSVYYGGYVKGLDLLPGQYIRKGQVLFSLENPDFVQMQQDYLETIATLEYLKTDFERQKTLAAENIASQKNFLKAESDYEVQRARSEGLKKKLEMLGIDLDRVAARDFISRINVYAPISGAVTKVNVSGGSYLNASDKALEITSAEHLHLELDVFEKDVHLLRKDQKIFFRVPGSGDQNYSAKVHLIGGVVEGENRVVRVHGHLDKEAENSGLIPGMYVEANIETAADSALALPETAVISLEDDAFILVQKDRTETGYLFERRLVEAGRTVNGMTEIKSNMEAETPVLIKGAFNLIAE